VSGEYLGTLLSVDPEEWRAEIPSIEELYASLGDRVPAVLREQLAELARRLA
jgi:phosphoenolpyruvate carboxykinase (GTP)